MSTHTATDPNTGSSRTDTAVEAAKQTAGTTAEQAQALAATTAGQAKEVAGQAKQQLATVTGEARDQATKVLSTASSELGTQLQDRLGQAAGSARSTATQLQALAAGRPQEAGRAGEVIQMAGQRLDRFAERIDELGVDGVMDEIKDFARRRPFAFIAGALAAGVIVGRLARAGKEASSSGTGSRPTAVPNMLTDGSPEGDALAASRGPEGSAWARPADPTLPAPEPTYSDATIDLTGPQPGAAIPTPAAPQSGVADEPGVR